MIHSLTWILILYILTLSFGCNEQKDSNDNMPVIEEPIDEEPAEQTLTIYEKMAGEYLGKWTTIIYETNTSTQVTTYDTTINSATEKVYFHQDSTDLITSISNQGLSWFDDSTMTEEVVYYSSFGASSESYAWFYINTDSLVWNEWKSWLGGNGRNSTFRGKKK